MKPKQCPRQYTTSIQSTHNYNIQLQVLEKPERPIGDRLNSDDSLPGLDEIEATGELLFEQGNTRVLLLPSNYVVKFRPAKAGGHGPFESEAMERISPER